MNKAHEDSQNQPGAKGAKTCSGAQLQGNLQAREVSLIGKGILGAIRVYQLTLSPFIGGQCRFYPTCSHYASEAVAQLGAGKGVQLTLKRLAKCHPFHPGGVDLVPTLQQKKPQTKNKTPNTLATHV